MWARDVVACCARLLSVCSLYIALTRLPTFNPIVLSEHKCRFTALQWEPSHLELIIGDDNGYLYFWNIATERCVKTERLRDSSERTSTSIKTISTAAGEVLVASPVACGAWLVVRDVKYTEVKGHDGPVVALCVSDAGRDAARQRAAQGGFANGGTAAAAATAGSGGGDSSEPPLIYSASLDNTIRAYDPYDMATLSIMHEEQSEISCMHVSALSVHAWPLNAGGGCCGEKWSSYARFLLPPVSQSEFPHPLAGICHHGQRRWHHPVVESRLRVDHILAWPHQHCHEPRCGCAWLNGAAALCWL